MSVAAQNIELGEYALKCIDVIKTFVPGREDEVEPAITALAGIYAAENVGSVEERFKDHLKIFLAAAETMAATKELENGYNEFLKKGNS